jgi:alkylation response protein AidB-like acyl-CoA dehydrogenase
MSMFTFTQEQELLRKAIREFVENEIAPQAQEWDEQNHCPIELFQKLGKMGFLGIFVPQEYGGVGMGFLERTICLEELARHSAGLAITVMAHQLCMGGILNFGTEEQKQQYLPDLSSGKKIGSLSLTEATGGSDFMGQKSTGVLKDNQWIINGRKCFITNANVADVDLWTVITGKNEKGRPIMSAFIIDKGTPGHAAGRTEHKLGMCSSNTGDVSCVNVKLSPEQMLDQEGSGPKIALSTIQEVGRAGMSAISLGILRGCLEESIKFSKERITYGKPLSKLMNVQFSIAENKLDYESARLLTYRAAGMKDEGLPCACEFALSKYAATEGAIRAAKRTIDLMGGYGVINEYPIGRFLRDALAGSTAGGTTDILRVVIAAETLKN